MMTRLLSSSSRRQASVILMASTVSFKHSAITPFFATAAFTAVRTITSEGFLQRPNYFLDSHRSIVSTKLSFSSNSSNASDKRKNKKSGVRYNKKKQQNLFRADRVLSNRGLGTRSQTFDLLKSRRITMIIPSDDDDNENPQSIVLMGPAEKIPMDAKLLLDNTHEIPPIAPLLYIYHKPKFMLSAMSTSGADRDKKHLGQVIEPRLIKGGMHPVGRLDYDSSGLLLFSSNGDLTQRLLHPRYAVEKEYVATVEQTVDFQELSKKLKNGVETTEGIHTATLLDVTPPFRPEPSSLVSSGSDDDKSDDSNITSSTLWTDVRLVVTEGKYRMVRRMLANCGHPVVNLRRERYGEVLLNDLKVGEFREPTSAEVKWAESLLPLKKNKKKKS